jgi:Kinesin motor domain
MCLGRKMLPRDSIFFLARVDWRVTLTAITILFVDRSIFSRVISYQSMVSPSRKKTLNSVEFRSILRIRPLLGKERDDQVVLEPLEDGFAAALHPPVMKDGETTFLNALVSGQDLEFRFDRVLSKETNQEKTYSVVAQPMALKAMEPFKHLSESQTDTKSCTNDQLLICMGLPNSGSSFTCTGPISNRKNDFDGLFPRLFESLFLQCHHITSMSMLKSISFGVNFTAIQVNQSKTNSHECHVYDLVKPASKSSSILSVFEKTKKTLVENMANEHRGNKEFANGTPTIAFPVFCSSVAFARDCLKTALQRGRQTSQKKFQSHLFISLQPLLVSQNSGRILCKGGNISFLEMAGFDSKQRATRSREPSGSDAHAAIMHCLKAIRHNQVSSDGHRKIPYLQHKVTALLTPLFSSKKSSLSVTLLVTASPSIRDYSDKKILLTEISQLYVPPPSVDGLTGLSSISNLDKLHRNSRNQLNTRQRYSGATSSENNKAQSSKYLSENFLNDPQHGLPPPIVPGFTETNDNLIESCCVEATAPVENPDFTESEQGVPVNERPVKSKNVIVDSTPPGARDNNTNVGNLLPEPLRTHNNDDADVGDSLPESRFKYLKTINMVVHASKKKGLDIMKNITVTTVNREPYHAEQRVLELEKHAEKLLFEINDLKRRNQELDHRIRGKSEVEQKNLTAVPKNLDCFSPRSTGVTRVRVLKKGDSPMSTKTDKGFAESMESSVGLNENSLFQFMAKLNGENIAGDFQRPTLGNALQKPILEGDGVDSQNETDEFELDHETLNDETVTTFDDPLMQHMVLLNSYR